MFAWIKTFGIGAAITAAFIALALVLTPLVHADEGTFVDQLDAHGVTVTPFSIPLGHSVCAKVSQDGEYGVTEAATAMLRAGNSSHDAAAFVILSANELCPSITPAVNAWMADH